LAQLAQLLLPDGQGWNEEKFNGLFFQGDVEDIKGIPVGRSGTDDYIT
jgi:hypothetical protein